MRRPLRVLHLEDCPRDGEIVRHRLDADGLDCTILVVKDKGGFETALAKEPFELIISDYNLPGYDGLAALKQAQAVQPDVPVILISGTVLEEQAVNCLHIGATDYLLKERLGRLVPAVHRAVQEADRRRERKRVETALTESESRKAAVLDSVLDCIVTMDADGLVLEFNAAAERTFGYTKAEAIGGQLADLIIPPRFRDRHRAGLARYMATGDGPLLGTSTEMLAMRSDGSEIPVELAITAIRAGSAAIFTGVLRDITARKRDDATRARLAAIVDSSDDAIFSMDLDGTILTWNGGAERLYGYPASAMIGQNRVVLVPADRIAELVPIMDRAARGVAGVAVETKRIRKDGSIVDVSLVISPMTDPSGQVTGVSTIARDITPQRVAEAAVRGERDRAQRFLDTAEVILLGLNPSGQITLVNRYACSLFGWPTEELLRLDFVDTCVPARMRANSKIELAQMLSGPLSSVGESAIVTRSGEERLIEWRNTLQYDHDGRVTGTLSSGTDITERTAAVEALRQAAERTRFALAAANVGIWDLDYTTGILCWSDPMAAQYGLRPGTFGETFDCFVALVHPDDRASLLETIKEATKSGADFATQNRATWPDGSTHWLRGAGRILIDGRGAPVRGVGISQDVTERQTLEEQYRQAQKMEAVGQLAAGVAHDFNNLLTVILGFCELLLTDLDPADWSYADIAEIQKAGTRAARLTRQLLTFSRKEIIQLTLLDLNAVVGDVRSLLDHLIGEQVVIKIEIGADLAPVTCDHGQVEQVILNLAINARDAMPKGGTLTISTANVDFDEANARMHECVRAGRYVALRVADTGTGMSREVQAHMFEPFFTTKGVGKGTGLGLATVHGIVTRCFGGFSVESEIGRGTSFTAYFPRADTATPRVAVPPAAVRPRRELKTVLLVEDEGALRAVTQRLLVRLGYTVLLAANAAEAMQLFADNASIDLLLTDVVMPGASGPELAVRLVAERPALKAIYMSGYTDEAIVDQGVLAPGVAFLHKPFSSETLERKIREVADR
ncbi:MAG: PAS domain S-box protein [Casimicrobiaceae bacterium]